MKMKSFPNYRLKTRSELMNFVSQLRSPKQTVHLQAAICGGEAAAAERAAALRSFFILKRQSLFPAHLHFNSSIHPPLTAACCC